MGVWRMRITSCSQLPADHSRGFLTVEANDARRGKRCGHHRDALWTDGERLRRTLIVAPATISRFSAPVSPGRYVSCEGEGTEGSTYGLHSRQRTVDFTQSTPQAMDNVKFPHPAVPLIDYCMRF